MWPIILLSFFGGILALAVIILIRGTIFVLKANYLAKRIADEIGNVLEEFEWQSASSFEPERVAQEYPMDEIDEIKELLK